VKQKSLPAGVYRAGKWWGKSRSLKLQPALEVIGCEAGKDAPRWVEVRVLRCALLFIRRWYARGFQGGVLTDWKGEFSERLRGVVEQLWAYFRSQAQATGREVPRVSASANGGEA
jgi:hypothetical protein